MKLPAGVAWPVTVDASGQSKGGKGGAQRRQFFVLGLALIGLCGFGGAWPVLAAAKPGDSPINAKPTPLPDFDEAAYWNAFESIAPDQADGVEGSVRPLDSRHGRAVRCTFAVPEFACRISLGVFSQEGRLVRRLAEAQPEENFVAEINGLSVTWDGKDDSGREVAPGEYAIRGWALGFWEQSASVFLPDAVRWEPPFADFRGLGRALDIAATDGESFALLLAREEGSGPSPVTLAQGFPSDGHAAAIRNSADRVVVMVFNKAQATALWRTTAHSDEPGTWILARCGDTKIAAARGREIFVWDGQNGALLQRGKAPEPPIGPESITGLSAEGNFLFVCGQGKVWQLEPESWRWQEVEQSFPPGITQALRMPAGWLALGLDRRLWMHEKTWALFLPDHPATWFRIGQGEGESFWAVFADEASGHRRVGQFSWQGDFLRQITPDALEGEPQNVAVSPGAQRFLVLSSGAFGMQELIGIEKDLGAGLWRVFYRSLRDPLRLLTEDSWRPLPVRFDLHLRSNLTGREELAALRLVLEEDKVALRDLNGLLLGSIAELPGAGAAAVLARWDEEPPPSAEVPPTRRHPPRQPLLVFRWLRGEEVWECGVRNLERLDVVDGGTHRWPPEE